MKLAYLTLLLALLATSSLFAQDRERLDIKFGKLTAGELSLMPPGRDSAAEAYVLFDRSILDIDLDVNNAPSRQRRVHRRVKLIRESSFDRANVELYYRPKDEGITDLHACIFIPGEKVVKLNRKDFIREKYSDDVNRIKFTFPGVKEGAIIEYQYIDKSEYITVPDRFQFQESIPVRYVEYTSDILDIFQYVNVGNASAHDVKQSSFLPRQLGSRTHRKNRNVTAYYDLPSYEHQPYVNNFQDYLPYVQYQLQNIYPPDGSTRKVFTDWPQTIKELDDWATFGKAYRSNGMSNGVWKVAEPLLAGLSTETEKAQALYDFVISNIVWNDSYGWTSKESPDKVFEAKEGSSGEINILLLALLQRAGIESYPALVSLRDGGAPIQIFPILTQFDHVMVYAKIDGKFTWLDPNDSSRPMGLPRAKALNGAAMVADPEAPRWVNIDVPSASRILHATVVVNEKGVGTVDIMSKMQSYYAFSHRLQVRNMEEEDDFPIATDIMEDFPEAELLTNEVMEADKKSGEYNLKLSMEVPMGQVVDDYIYLQPILINAIDKKLADSERRLYPVDFNYPWLKRYVSTIKLPEGYVVDEIPEPSRITSEDGSMTSLFRAMPAPDGSINLEFRVQVKRTVYSAGEYEVLREMFERIIDTQDTVIVLKKAK